MNNIIWRNEKRKLSDLVPADYNPRRLTEKQYKELKKSLTKFGLAEIPAINTDNTILAGHQRVKILLELYGLEREIDVRVPDHELTEGEAKEYNLRSNKNTGEFDFDMLANFDTDLLLDVGFTDQELQIDDIDQVSNEKQKTCQDKYCITIKLESENEKERLLERLKEMGYLNVRSSPI